jgi:acetolactate synthase-1/2/3 large subunit
MGLGTALGVKYAQPERPVAMLIGDGSFYYNPVPAAFGACQEHALPMLVVMFDNAGYFSQKADVVREFPDGWAVRTRKFAGTSIAPQPDYPALARAFGGWGVKVEKPREVRAALEQGFKAASEGKVALVHLVLDAVNPQ